MRTRARASAKVGRVLEYQAARRWVRARSRSRVCAVTMTQLKRPSKTGVVRAMAGADHWRWVFAPRWARTAWKITSTCQRRRKQVTIVFGVRCASVQSRAVGARTPSGSRSSTQRRGTTGWPDRYQRAVPVAHSRTRPAAPVVPAPGERHPGRLRVRQPLLQRGQARALEPRAALLARQPRGWRGLQGRVQA